MEKHAQKSCIEFSELLAAKTPVPGGGGASALAGALGIALCAMVANYTIGKPKYAACEPEMENIRDQAEGIRGQLLDLMDADAHAFLVLSEAYALSKTDSTRSEKLEQATLGACAAPMEMINACCHALELLSRVLAKGSKMLISDTGCGAILCKAAMESAAMNVHVNTKTLRDRGQADRLNGTVKARMEQYGPVADRIIQSVQEQLIQREDA